MNADDNTDTRTYIEYVENTYNSLHLLWHTSAHAKKSDTRGDDSLPELETPQALTSAPAMKASSQFVISFVR